MTMPHTATDNATSTISTTTTKSTRRSRRFSRSAGIVVTVVAVLAVVGIDRGVAGKVKTDTSSAVKIRFVEPSALPAAAKGSDNKITARLASSTIKPTIAIENNTTTKTGAPVELLRDLSNGPQTVTMEVTAYCPCPKCCGAGAIGLTASGKRITYNNGRFVAADKVLPFGTKLVIPGYNNGESVEVMDRGGAIKGNKLDVFFPTHDQAKAWGRRMIAVTIVR
jgi:3D (Asp-Asp-Asp) domain-containing protein